MTEEFEGWNCGWTEEIHAIVAAGGDLILVGDRAVAFWLLQFGVPSRGLRIDGRTPFCFFSSDRSFEAMRRAAPAGWLANFEPGAGPFAGSLERAGEVRRIEVFREVPGLDLFEPFWTSSAHVESLHIKVPGPLGVLGVLTHRLSLERSEATRQQVRECIEVVNRFVATLAKHDPGAALERAICLTEAMMLPDTRKTLIGSEIRAQKALPVEAIKRIAQLGSSRQRASAEDVLRRWAEVERDYRSAGESRSLSE